MSDGNIEMKEEPEPMEEQEQDQESNGAAESPSPAPPPAAQLLMIVNDMGMEEEAEDPEENKPPRLHHKEVARVKSSNSRERETSQFSTPPPALSPAYSLQEGAEGVEKEEPTTSASDDEQEPEQADIAPNLAPVAPVAMSLSLSLRKIESSPAIVGLEKEKRTYKFQKKDKEAVPFIDPNAPKRNRSAYVHFIISRRASYSKTTMSQRDINIGLAKDWQKLTAEERIPFHKKAEEEKNTYISLMEVYKKTDSHKEFQKKRQKYVQSQNASTSNNKKRKHTHDSDDDDDDSNSKIQMAFPKTSVFCPLLKKDGEETSSSQIQYAGPIFTPEFMAYNKTRDTYRRQLAMERSTVEHELEALHQHDVEVKIQKQLDKIKGLDDRIDKTLEVMDTIFGGIPGAKDHLDDIESLTEWLRSLPKNKKSVKEALQKHAKSVKK